MTYDEAVNDLVRRYRDGAFPDWTMTDDDSAQMRRNLGNGRLEFVDFQNLALFHNIIDMNYLTDGELWYYGSQYYDSREEFFDLGADIMAECVFELTPADEVFSSPEGIVDDVYSRYLKIVQRGEEA